MNTTDGPAHLLSLKVMRLSRPDLASAWQPFYSSSPSFSAHSSASFLSLQSNSPLCGHPKTLRDLTSSSEILTLPTSFGSIQLGETFSSCLSVNNETAVDIEVAQVRVEMQTATSKMVLYEMDGLGKSLTGGDALEHTVHHEIKELGQHVLACTVTYRLPQNARAIAGASEDVNDPSLQTFRKFYKFAVTNPFSVKTKVHSAKSPSALFSPTEKEKIFLEVHIQNLTQDVIYFERMRLECTDEWEIVDGNLLPGSDDGNGQSSIFSGNMALMQPQDMRQYLYILNPKVLDLSSSSPAPGSIIPLGRMDILWKSHFGEPGRLLTSMLSRRIPLPPAQPASAVPPHLKKSISGTPLPRPYPSGSRPGTPVLGQRAASPAMARTSISSDRHAAVVHTPTSELEVQLFVRHIPRDHIAIEKPFSIAFSVVISSTVRPGREQLKRKVSLGVQHLRRQRQTSSQTKAVPAQQDSNTPRLPYSGFSSPASTAAGGFNYALAHQKILASSPRPSATDLTASECDHLYTFPSPFYEGGAENAAEGRTRNILTFVGQSVTMLPPVEINYTQCTARHEQPAKIQHTQDFELTFVGLRSGFSIVQGLRILLTDDQLLDDMEESHDKSSNRKNTIEILKEYDTVAEVWVAS